MNQVVVLITDDDEDDRLFLRQAIERHINTATIHEARDGHEALNFLNQQADKSSFNLILLDVNMPGMNGFEVLDKIRSTPSMKHMPTIMISTSDHPQQVAQAYKKGVNSYIKKPRSFAEYDVIAKAIETCFLSVGLK